MHVRPNEKFAPTRYLPVAPTFALPRAMVRFCDSFSTCTPITLSTKDSVPDVIKVSVTGATCRAKANSAVHHDGESGSEFSSQSQGVGATPVAPPPSVLRCRTPICLCMRINCPCASHRCFQGNLCPWCSRVGGQPGAAAWPRYTVRIHKASHHHLLCLARRFRSATNVPVRARAESTACSRETKHAERLVTCAAKRTFSSVRQPRSWLGESRAATKVDLCRMSILGVLSGRPES